MGRLDEAREANAQALATLRDCGDKFVAECLSTQGLIEAARGDVRTARDLYAQALAAFRALGDELGTAVVLTNLAGLEFSDRHADQALRCAIEAQDLDARGKNVTRIATDHANIAAYRIALGDIGGARESAREGLRLSRQAQSELITRVVLGHIALLASLGGDPQRGARLLGYVDAQYEQLGTRREPTERWIRDELLTLLRRTLSDDEITQLTADGATRSEDQALTLAS